MRHSVTSGENTPFEFPCEFPIKAIGYASDNFEAAVATIIRKHVYDIPEGAFKIRQSKTGLYTSMTITITASNREQLDAIYQDLSTNEHILMAL